MYDLTATDVGAIIGEARRIKMRSQQNGFLTLWEDGKLDGMIAVLNIVAPSLAEAVLDIKQSEPVPVPAATPSRSSRENRENGAPDYNRGEG